MGAPGINVGRWVACLTTGLALATPVQAETILERVLSMLDAQGFSGVFANVAENASRMVNLPRSLSQGDQVIIGFDASGAAVTALAHADGLRVDPATAGTLVSGLAAGIYPVGSSLYRLPPAGQLSLFEQDRAGQALALAREFLTTRIDGSIQFSAFAKVTEDPAVVATASLSVTLADPLVRSMSDKVASTVLGAVNSGAVLKGLDLGGGVPAEVSSLVAGANGHLERAMTAGARAQWVTTSPFGGSDTGAVLALNAAANTAEVTGALRIRIEAASARIGAITSTVIGAVNSGVVRTPGP